MKIKSLMTIFAPISAKLQILGLKMSLATIKNLNKNQENIGVKTVDENDNLTFLSSFSFNKVYPNLDKVSGSLQCVQS